MTTTTFPAAAQALKDALVAGWAHADVPLRYQNDEAPLPDTPSPFVLVEVLGQAGGGHVGWGGGRGNNIWRQLGRVEMHVFIPTGWGPETAWTYAQEIASLLEGKGFSDVQCWEATIDGGGRDADQGNYWLVTAVVFFSFDRVG